MDILALSDFGEALQHFKGENIADQRMQRVVVFIADNQDIVTRPNIDRAWYRAFDAGFCGFEIGGEFGGSAHFVGNLKPDRAGHFRRHAHANQFGSDADINDPPKRKNSRAAFAERLHIRLAQRNDQGLATEPRFKNRRGKISGEGRIPK